MAPPAISVGGQGAAGSRLVTLALYGAPSVLPDISPSWGEIGSFADRASFQKVGDWRNTDDGRSPPCGGDVRQDRGGRGRAPTLPKSPEAARRNEGP
ncbi:hypothetical protein MES5069_180081 [Mesorhizobium escarrei]|uniref:Uncharacterized protein n=1 Tax=Mesorhizobium escarrei TaxID=666018 RepID=A0ABN8JIR5_9HYPH|nr:hypothetical protein MES5069_180081 [Mesorhizobium escarrei]